MKRKRADHNCGLHVLDNNRGSGKAAFIAMTITILLLAALSAISCLAKRQDDRRLLLAAPLGAGTPGLAPDRLEDFIEENFLLTYEISKPATVQAVNQNHLVTVVGTNSHYAGLLGYANLDGGFLIEAAIENQQRHAVLNETAAFQIFGGVQITGQSLKLDGESWIITGVVQDGDTDHANVYVPSGITGGEARSIIALLDDTVSEPYAKNALKSIGIHDSSYSFVNLFKSVGIFEQYFSVALKAALFALLFAFAIRTGDGLLGRLQFFRSKLSEVYIRELVACCGVDCLKTIATIPLLAGSIVAMLYLSLQILKTCLTWQDVPWITGGLTVGDFSQRLIWLRNMQPICLILFAVCIAGIVASLILYLLHRCPANRK